MTISRFVAGACAVAALLALTAGPAVAKPDREDSVVPYERDVYVIVGSTLRNPTGDTAPDAPLFNVAGVNLSQTWGQFSSATATAKAALQGGKDHPRTDIHVELRGLVPGALYSLFYVTIGPDSENPLCPGVERGLPLLATKQSADQPDASSFFANADGTAKFHARADGNQLAPQQLIYELVYHSDGRSYGALPNAGEYFTQDEDSCRSSFGEDAMRQLLVFQTGG